MRVGLNELLCRAFLNFHRESSLSQATIDFRLDSKVLERLRLGADWRDHGLVFPTTIGTPYTSSLTNSWFKPALVKAELAGFNLYSLRHTHATLLLANGENAKVSPIFWAVVFRTVRT